MTRASCFFLGTIVGCIAVFVVLALSNLASSDRPDPPFTACQFHQGVVDKWQSPNGGSLKLICGDGYATEMP